MTGGHNRRRVGLSTTGAVGTDDARSEGSGTGLSLLLVKRRKQFRALSIELLLLHGQVGYLWGGEEVVMVARSKQHGMLGSVQQLLHALTQAAVVRAVEQQVIEQGTVFRLHRTEGKGCYREMITDWYI